MTLNERYQVHERVGEGGMALVYHATDLRLSRPVAVKMLRPQFAGDPEFVGRFEQEARAAAGLSHPNIAAVFDTGEDAGHHYIVMELLRPFTLKDLIGRSPQGRVAPAEAVRIGSQIAAALSLAHQRGVIHRDVKPQNILFTDDGIVKVTDFGIARALVATSGTATGTILGSPHYLSPEQASGAPSGPSSDLYSLGVVLYEMLCGRPPFSGETPVAIAVQHLRNAPPPLRSLAPDVPPGLDAVVAKALQKEPGDRFQTAEEMRQALETCLTAPGAPGLDQTQVMGATARQRAAEYAELEADEEPYRREPPGRRGLHPALLVLLALLVIGGAVLGIVFAGGAKSPTPDKKDEPPKVEITKQQYPAPDLKSMDVDEARSWVEATFRGQQLEPPQVVEAARKDSDAPKNQILSQEPVAGTKMDEGGIVRVVLSTGVVSREVPNVVGLTVDRAKSLLQDTGLMLGNVTQANSDVYVADVVMKQTPAAGAKAGEGSAVGITVSLGPKSAKAVDTPPPTDTPPPPEDKPKGRKSNGPQPQVIISVGAPVDAGNGQKEATVVVSVPEKSADRRLKLEWLSGAEGGVDAASVAGGHLYKKKVKGPSGAVLGVYVDGELKDQVSF